MPRLRILLPAFSLVVSLASPVFAAEVVTTPYDNLNLVTRLCFDPAGNLYVTQRNTVNRVLKIPPGGPPAVFATGFSDPLGIVCDSQGNLFVTNYIGDRVDKVTPDGTRTTFASGINEAHAIVIDGQDNLYVAQYGAQTVKKITPAGTVSDYGNARLGSIGSLTYRLTALCLEPDGSLLCGTFGPGSGQGPYPIRRIPPGGGDGVLVVTSSLPITDIAIGPDGLHYYACYQDNVIGRSLLPSAPVVYAGTGAALQVDGALNHACFYLPAGLAFSPDHRLYIADTTNDAIRAIDGIVATGHGTWGRLKGLYRR